MVQKGFFHIIIGIPVNAHFRTNGGGEKKSGCDGGEKYSSVRIFGGGSTSLQGGWGDKGPLFQGQ